MVEIAKPKTESQDCYTMYVGSKMVLFEVTSDECEKHFFHHCANNAVLEVHYLTRQIKMMKKDIHKVNQNLVAFGCDSHLGKGDRTKKLLSHPQQAHLYQEKQL